MELKLEFGKCNRKTKSKLGDDATVVILGDNSDGLCCLNIDTTELIMPKSINGKKTCIEKTPNGYHIYFRSHGTKTNLKLSPTCDLYRGNERYMICYPTDGYRFVNGSFDEIPIYTEKELEELINLFIK